MDRIIEKKKWTVKKILQYTAILVFAIFLIYIFLLRDRSSRLTIDKTQITTDKVALSNFQEFIPVDGIVLPKTTIYIDAVLGGTVETKYVEDGAEVKAGDMILKLSNANMQLSYMDQETRMYDAINNLQNSRIALEQNKYIRQREITNLLYQIDQVTTEFERAKKLYNEGVYTLKEYEDAKRDFDFSSKQLNISLELQRLDSISAEDQKRQIAASVDRMKTNLALLQSNMERLLVLAPADGVLSSFNVEIGETRSAGERLGQIDIMDGYKMRANIDERYVSRVVPGQEAELDFGGKTYQLYVYKIYTGVTGGAFQVDMMFRDEVPANIKRGQTIQMRLQFSTPTEALILKRGGFFQQTGGNWVYVVDPSGKYAVKRNIKLGRQNTRFYEVLEGLEAGEEVIVSSYDSFGEKDKLVLR
ncbi:MAG TPA: HlyD family efflux transporter periplasmic adaptor subunit [Bacteroidales bacterium]|nr:HlyD family efflux transporter periplasmic adaptor subunit [Bacteroidales bacterium]HPI85516.1 HlyD family efflux transporter periplasmic adaptor subunit [Bacteroidales bacterium]HPM93441.1 HlyD family efflux transporter periplasmic adaptor subunit [Bacteroidales bacterium]